MANPTEPTLPKKQPVKKGITPTQKKPMAAQPPAYAEGLELVKLRNNFYRDNYRRLMIVCLGLILLSGCLLAWGIYERNSKPPTQYFATTYDGKLIPLIPLSQPALSNSALIEWVNEAAVSAYTFNYVNYRKALQDLRVYFTQTGYQSFLKALEESNNLNAVQVKKMIVSAQSTGAPRILKEGVYNGFYMWDVQLPMEITYQGATDSIKQNVLLTMRVQRVSTLDSPSGIAISTFVISTVKG